MIHEFHIVTLNGCFCIKSRTFHVVLHMRYLTDFECNIIEGMLTPVGVMALIEVTTIGAMAVYVNKKGNFQT